MRTFRRRMLGTLSFILTSWSALGFGYRIAGHPHSVTSPGHIRVPKSSLPRSEASDTLRAPRYGTLDRHETADHLRLPSERARYRLGRSPDRAAHAPHQ